MRKTDTMKKMAAMALLAFFAACRAPETGTGTITVEGIAARSKGGLVVDGVMLPVPDERDRDAYAGERVRVRGAIEKDHPQRITGPGKNGEYRQGFDMPVMYRIDSIEVIGR